MPAPGMGIGKKALSERDICTKYITPAIVQAGWDLERDIREEVPFTDGRVIARGKHHTRGERKRADYILNYQNIRLAIVEAKKNELPVGHGMQQALAYAEALQVPFVFTSNGDGFLFHDRTRTQGPIERELGLDEFPSPEALIRRYQEHLGLTDAQLSIVTQDPYSDGKEPRYYQVNAITRTLEAIARGQQRILLVMATGTGKNLEQRQERKRSAAIHVSKASLDSLVNAEGPDETVRAWRRVAQNINLVAAEGHVDRLRESVLQLATRGKLSTRKDEQSAKDLLNEIQADRAIAFDNEDAQCPSTPGVVNSEESPYALPSHWSWVRVEDLCTFIVDCLHKTPEYVDAGGYPCIRTSEITRGALPMDKASRVSEETYLERIGRLRPVAGDIVYAREGRYGVAALVPPEVDVCLGQRTMMLRVSPLVSAEYFMWTLNSDTIFAQARKVVGGSTAPHVNIRAIRRFVFPLPPIQEQAQIVAAIRQPFTLCDQLETAYSERATSIKRIVRHVGHISLSGTASS